MGPVSRRRARPEVEVSAAGTKAQRRRAGLGASAAAVVLIACLCATGGSLSGALLATHAGRQAPLQGRVLLDRAWAASGEPTKGVVLLTDTTKSRSPSRPAPPTVGSKLASMATTWPSVLLRC